MAGASTVPCAGSLDAALRLIVDRLAPDQVILFGSAARGDMTPSSDLDFLVIKQSDDVSPSTWHDRWECPEAGGHLDVVVTTRADAERYRLSASRVHGSALEEGRTLYVRAGAVPLSTGVPYVWNGVELVRSTCYEPDHAAELLDRAEAKLEDAHRTRYAVDRCEYLQQSLAYAFKALIAAGGRRVQHVHDLNALWQQAEAAGDRIDAARDPQRLERLGGYAAHSRCDALPADADSALTWEENRGYRRPRSPARPRARAATRRADPSGSCDPRPRDHRS